MQNHLTQDMITKFRKPDIAHNMYIENSIDMEKQIELHARPIIDDKYWVVENNGRQLATLRKDDDNRFVLSNTVGIRIYQNKKELTKQFGKDFFIAKIIRESDNFDNLSVQDYPTSTKPCNSMFDIKRKLPLFTKSKESKSVYCAGYYIIKYDKSWARSFCPKLITLQRYPYQGPYHTELEMKKALSNASK
jgi:hypothetical protein